ncbi:clostripain-related cysteine peptidase [Jannaschia seohaensis]|uniref:Clostripain n=1 Tax=Jannaschia seohaensis TaxID=475081 RepID=A0A2Y9B707_9RHOB|nr:clostripain-related cysteine peptidase [Jannaschia seohaensis]PWJ11772.1 clostripain [Jannaschia seohaensis]SSA51288.1 clostripain [Jannaschia seohaensis]
MIRTRAFLAAAFSAAALLSSGLPSQAQDGLSSFGKPEIDPDREWTVMVYLDGDNDLEYFALSDINEMEAGLPERGVEVVVLLDRAQGFDDSDGDWTEARVYRVTSDTDPEHIASDELARLGEVNMGAPETLASFVSASINKFPARNYAVVLWDHGGGWRSMASDHDAPGTSNGYDDFNLAEVSEGLRTGLARTSVKKLDIVGFDMCLMAQLETGYELRKLADVLVASQAVEPGDGWPYDAILPEFGKETLGAQRLGAAIVEAYGAYYGARNETVATLSAIDLAEMTRVANALDTISTSLAGSLSATWSDVSRSLFYSESYSERTDVRHGNRALASVDLLDMVGRLRHSVQPFPAEDAYRDLVDAMDRAVIANYHSPRHRLSHGMAIYAPLLSEQFNEDYATTALAARSTWTGLLKDLHTRQAENLTRPDITSLRIVDTQTGETVSGGTPGGGFGLEAVVEGENVLWVQSLQATHDAENGGLRILEHSYIVDPEYYNKQTEAVASVVDLIMPEFKGSQNTVSQEFVGRRFYVSDGETAGLATIDGSSLTDLTTVAVPVLLGRGDEEYFATVYFNVVNWYAVSVVVELPQPDGTVAFRQIRPEPDDKITLLFEFIPEDGGDMSYLRGAEMSWRNGLELIVGNDDPGEIVVAVRAESIGGLSNFVSASIAVEGYDAQEQQFFDQAKELTPQMLPGKWRWNGLIDGEWKPIPLVTEIRPHERDPSILVSVTTNDEDADFVLGPSEVVLDTRLTPTLRMIRYDDEGYPLESDVYTLLVSRWEAGSPRILMKQLVPKGWLILLTREGEPPAGQTAPQGQPPATQPSPPGQTPGTQPTPTPQAPAAVSLAGYWQGTMGLVLAMNDTNYELYEYGELVDAGTYQIDGNLMYTVDFWGESSVYNVQYSGNSFALQDEYGDIYQFTRIQ